MTKGPVLRAAATTIAAAAALLGAGAACAQPQNWRHAIIEPKGDAGFQVMAVRGGFAAKQNLKLELPTFQNDVIALRGLLAGELDSYEGGAATAILAAARNGDVKIVGCHWQTVVHSVFGRAEVKGPQDLKGNTMAISAPNATPDMIGRAYLAQNNVPASEVKFASPRQRPRALQGHAGRHCGGDRDLDRVPADRRALRDQAARARQRRDAEVPAALHGDDGQADRGAAQRRHRLPDRADAGLPPRARQSRRGNPHHPRGHRHEGGRSAAGVHVQGSRAFRGPASTRPCRS